MGVTVRKEVAKASAKTVWATCFAPMKWESWDVDVTKLDDVSGPLEDGTTCTFVMKDGGSRIPTTVSGVEQDKAFTFSGSAVGGLMKFCGVIELNPVPVDEGESPRTEINYSFEMSGLVGMLFNTFKSSAVVGGVEKGLENIVQLSEQAESN